MQQIALVTGADKGIGLETARQLAEHGMTVLLGARDIGRGEAAAAALRATGLDVVALELDVADDTSIAGAAGRVAAEFDHLDVLVNNAAVYTPTSPSTTNRMVMRQLFETNVFGVVAMTNAFLPLLREARSGRIVNVSSEVASLGTITEPNSYLSGMHDLAYQSSKGAMNWITVLFSKELADTRIKVNAAIPGYAETDLNDHSGTITPAEGAAASVALALLRDDGPTRTFWGTLATSRGGQKAVAPW